LPRRQQLFAFSSNHMHAVNVASTLSPTTTRHAHTSEPPAPTPSFPPAHPQFIIADQVRLVKDRTPSPNKQPSVKTGTIGTCVLNAVAIIG
jgi:hypothetical protein